MVWAQAIAACSTTCRKASDRFCIRILLALRGCPVRRKLASRRAITAIAEDVVGLHQFMNLARSLVDDRSLAVSVEASHGIFVRVAVRAVHLHRVAGRAFRGDGGEPFRKARLARVAAAGILEVPGLQP